MDVPELAILEEARGNEQAMVRRLLDERDHGGQPGRRLRQAVQPRVIEPHRDLAGQILEEIPGQAELGEDDQPAALTTRLRKQVQVALEVFVERTEPRGDLGERDSDGLHESEDTRTADGGRC